VSIGSDEDCSNLLPNKARGADNAAVVDGYIRGAVFHPGNNAINGPIPRLLGNQDGSVVSYVYLVEGPKDQVGSGRSIIDRGQSDGEVRIMTRARCGSLARRTA